PEDVSEFELTGLTTIASQLVTSPRVAECKISFECRLFREIELGETMFVVGEIVLAHAADEVLTDGRIDPVKLLAIGRLGGDDYTIVRDVVSRKRPVVKSEG